MEQCRVVLRYIFQGSGKCLLVGFGIGNVECLFGVFLPQRWFYIYIPRCGFRNLKLVCYSSWHLEYAHLSISHLYYCLNFKIVNLKDEWGRVDIFLM